ncbi:MAG: tRNA 5-methoxyuridine(34)/uridine 5-oxyacetic acid(34) synthase CmoB [Zetaproteobacteria bacterium]|nr:MAG: tRNA 5-methoxyuridine(34)/uridine 5-oxyacetic acid(34) synthase CmoB [Zetaproteobacteria bacterium]
MDEFLAGEETRLRATLASRHANTCADALISLMREGWQRVYAHGDWPRWREALDHLPAQAVTAPSLDADCVTVGPACDHEEQRRWLMQLHPWRKGPFRFFGTHIDTEWRSDWKWRRLAQRLPNLAGQCVLDVGCGSGYYLWRMVARGATAIGIDPTPLFAAQFALFKRCLPDQPAFFLPVGIESMPRSPLFDTVFSMGILYHRRAPIEHLIDLRSLLKPGGLLILETLIVAGGAEQCLVPRRRYAKMRNVWFIPSVPMLEIWLKRCGFRDIQCIDISPTTPAEQRRTPWMRFESLAEFLDADDPSRTVEGYPAPRRAILFARN